MIIVVIMLISRIKTTTNTCVCVRGALRVTDRLGEAMLLSAKEEQEEIEKDARQPSSGPSRVARPDERLDVSRSV